MVGRKNFSKIFLVIKLNSFQIVGRKKNFCLDLVMSHSVTQMY